MCTYHSEIPCTIIISGVTGVLLSFFKTCYVLLNLGGSLTKLIKINLCLNILLQRRNADEKAEDSQELIGQVKGRHSF